MKTIYLVFSEKYGLGGHYRSLKSTRNSLSPFIENSIVFNIGLKPTPVLKNEKQYFFFKITLLTIIYLPVYLKQLVKKEHFTVIHCFDIPSFFLARVVSKMTACKVVFTKCGGKNAPIPRGSESLVLFSGENYTYYKEKYFENLFYLPNRVENFSSDNLLANELLTSLGIESDRIILRIGRIDNYYKNVINSTIEVKEYLNKISGQIWSVIFVGHIYDPELVQQIEENDHVYFVDNEKYTVNAKKILPVGKIIVGTGRGVMEALSQGKDTVSFVKDKAFPLVVDKDSINHFLYYNFSERVVMPQEIYNKLLEKTEMRLKSIVNEKIRFDDVNKDIFKSFGDIENIKKDYLAIYTNAAPTYNRLLCLYSGYIYYFFKRIVKLKLYQK